MAQKKDGRRSRKAETIKREFYRRTRVLVLEEKTVIPLQELFREYGEAMARESESLPVFPDSTRRPTSLRRL
ncbi:MAG: hypothetical protein NTY66_00825 [Candidatus Vogelbacteria bacterium]|nr:hypothetical protein [Candidatus Vogelbacteria bacterium]